MIIKVEKNKLFNYLIIYKSIWNFIYLKKKHFIFERLFYNWQINLENKLLYRLKLNYFFHFVIYKVICAVGITFIIS